MAEDSLYFLAFIFYDIILFAIFEEIVFRRALIPTLEDRGSSPFNAVLLAALGSAFIDLPAIFLIPNYPYDVYSFSMVVIRGICAGLIYIATRNIIFPIIFTTVFYINRSLGFFLHGTASDVYELLNIVLPLLGVILIVYVLFTLIGKKETPKLLKILRIRSSSKMFKGVIGFLGISLGLLAIQTIVVKTGRILFDTELNGPFPEYFIYICIFYAIAFSIPFFLTISTQWAKHPTN
jgi:membrane protease YdiL (CAAX protease family)